MRRFALALAFVVLPAQAGAHDWYPRECCADHDCHPVPCDQIKATGMEYIYQGEFSRGRAMSFAKPMFKGPAPDGLCHVCINSATTIPGPMCIYIGGGT